MLDNANGVHYIIAEVERNQTHGEIAMTKFELHQIRRRSFRFRDINNARNFRDNAATMLMIVHGDDGHFWVTTPADATRLQRAGYEVAK